MRDKFIGYYSPSKSEFQKLWNTALISIDTNVLLDLYRYSEDTRKELIKVFKSFSDRLFLPYWAGLEFHRNRLEVIKDQEASYFKLIENINATKEELTKQLRSNRHPYIKNSEKTVDKLHEIYSDICKELENEAKEYSKYLKNDNILNEITALFKNKVGNKYNDDELKKIYDEGKIRYEKKIPPGYEDSKTKKDEQQYGDLVIWFQLMDMAKKDKTPIILITSEQKEDWWYKFRGEIISPRPELIEEMNEKCETSFYMYRVEPFLIYAREHLKTDIKDETIDEIKAVRKSMDQLQKERDAINKLLHTESFLSLVKQNEEIKTQFQNSKAFNDLMNKNEIYKSAMNELMNSKNFNRITESLKSFYDLNHSKELIVHRTEIEKAIKRMLSEKYNNDKKNKETDE